MIIFKKAINFFDRLEDRIRGKLSKFPIVYGLVGGVGIVLFWRGIWYLADVAFAVIARWHSVDVRDGAMAISGWLLLDGLLSSLIGAALLLITGLFVFNFLGSGMIISGLKREEKEIKEAEKEIKEAERETESEAIVIAEVREELREVAQQLDKLEELEKHKHPTDENENQNKTV